MHSPLNDKRTLHRKLEQKIKLILQTVLPWQCDQNVSFKIYVEKRVCNAAAIAQ